MIYKIILISIEPGVVHWCKHVWETSWEYYRYYSLYKVHMKLGHSVLKILIEMGDIYRSDTSRIVHQPWFLINFLDFWAFKFVCYSHKLVTYFCQSDISLSTYEYLKRCLIYIESRMVPVHHHYFFLYKTPK